MTVWDGFARFAATPVPAPPAPGAPARSLQERVGYHSRFVTVRTPAIDMLAKQVRTLMILGRHQQVTARPSLIVTGPAGAGKTTALLQVGRACHLAHTRRQDEAGVATGGQVPVAYVLVPPAASAKTLALEFARFLSVPVTARMSQAAVVNSVCHTYTQAGVRLVLIDEIHRLNPRTTTGAQSADLIKDLTERIGATFVYAGIDVTGTTLFSGVRGAQLAARASLVDCDPFPAHDGTCEPFKDLVRALENALDLRYHRAGSLVRLAPYLHERTAGRIGSLARLVKQAAITTLIDGTERITKATLDGVRLDHLAEQHYRPRTRTKPGSR
ncbi:TniB family NTP-binding protein [Streptomyces sp. CB02959]|uniref:TniB family NTP-binding protein n=1 Tax=Streptomyces sp. CB02959 TaxID=2020330 RepID=UPI002152CDEE|nr:TniB family NTP-binding protein [Streptomyces sp. CB02959]